VDRDPASGELCSIRLSDFSVTHEYSFVCLPDSLYETDYADFFSFVD